MAHQVVSDVTIPADVVAFMATERRGLSSNFILEHLFSLSLNGPHHKGPQHPLDPDDLTRCVRLVEGCPSVAGRFHEMQGASSWWAGLVAEWGALVALLDEEIPRWREQPSGSAPRCYAAMKRVEAQSRG